jgi:hypothetical protein
VLLSVLKQVSRLDSYPVRESTNDGQDIGKIVPRLSQACFIIREVKPFVSQDALNMICYAYFNSVMTYGLLFWGNSSHSRGAFNYKRK